MLISGGVKIKKILPILVVVVFLAGSLSVITTGKHAEMENENLIEKDEVSYKTFIEGDEEYSIVNGKYVLKAFPEKTQEQLDKMLVDPEPTVAATDLPGSFSWLSFGGNWLTPAKDQANCGSCWAFGALGAMEAGINIAKGDPEFDPDLSEQYVLSCLPASGSCSGGWMSEAIEYIESTDSGSTGNGINGCPLESCMPYMAVDYIPCSDKCSDWDYITDPIQEDNVLFEVENYGITSTNPNSPSDWDLLKSWVYTYGPLSVDIYASSGWSNFFWSHHSPNDVYEGSETSITNHAQVLCGWVDDSTVKNGGYWILKNSWGTSFGYNGFGNVAYGCLNVADRDVTWVTTPEWPQAQQPNPDVPIRYVYADWSYDPPCPRLGDTIEFIDESRGPVALWEWDFNGDGVVDSNSESPEFVYNTEGLHNVKLKVYASSGLSSELEKKVEVKEIWEPTAVSKPSYYGDDDPTVSFEGRFSYDVDGTVEAYAWDFDGDGTIDSTDSYDTYNYPDENAEYTATLTVTDNEGATNTVEIPVKIDKSMPPETTARIGGIDQDEEQWFNEKTEVELFATDWSALNTLYYRINGGDWQEKYCQNELEASVNFVVYQEGIHTVDFYATDKFGNTETTKSVDVKIDKSNPTISYTLEGEKDEDVFLTPVKITLIGNDEESAIDIISYRTSFTNWEEYTGPFTINDGGSHTFFILAEDLAGNVAEDSFTITLEYGPDAPTIRGPSSGATGQQLSFRFRTTDMTNDDVSYYIDWGDGSTTGWTDYVSSGTEITEEHVFTEQESYTIKAKAKDDKGAESDWTEFSVTMPRSVNKFVFLQYILEKIPMLSNILQRLFLI